VRIRHLTGPSLLLIAWWVVTALGWVGSDTLPSPASVIDAGVRLAESGELSRALVSSLQRVVLGLGFGVAGGMVIAVLAGWSRIGESLLDSTMQVIKAVPSVALAPLFVVWLGIDEAPKVLLIALSTSMPIYMNTYGAIRNLDVRLVETGRLLGLRQREIVRHVVVPSTVPAFLVGLRVSMANAWIALIFAEQINAENGLGKLMSDARTWLRLDIMMLLLVIYAVLGLSSYSFVRFLERRLLQWRRGFAGT
jgi:sulfonate transport system permease protein